MTILCYTFFVGKFGGLLFPFVWNLMSALTLYQPKTQWSTCYYRHPPPALPLWMGCASITGLSTLVRYMCVVVFILTSERRGRVDQGWLPLRARGGFKINIFSKKQYNDKAWTCTYRSKVNVIVWPPHIYHLTEWVLLIINDSSV